MPIDGVHRRLRAGSSLVVGMPMLRAMATLVLASALRHARDSWRGQLAVLAIGSLLLGLTVSAADIGAGMGMRAVVGMIELMVLLAVSVRAAGSRHRQVDVGHVLHELHEIGRFLPRLASQVGVAMAPAILLGVATLQVAGAVSLLGLALMPVTFATWIASAPVALLAVVAVVQGDRDWLPRVAFGAVRARPGALILAALVGMVAASMAALPLVLVGLVFTALAGWLGLLGAGLACAAAVPWLGCWALAMWQHVGAVVQAWAIEAVAEDLPIDERLAAFVAEPAPWVDGPSWDIALEPGTVWGTWVRVDATAQVAFRLTWSGTVAPQLALATEAGAWSSPGVAVRPGDAIPAVLSAGNTYVQVAATDVAAQAIGITMLVRGAAAA